MNPMFQAAKQTMSDEVGLLMGLVSVAFMGIFLGWTWWAYAPSRSARMEALGNLPLEDQE